MSREPLPAPSPKTPSVARLEALGFPIWKAPQVPEWHALRRPRPAEPAVRLDGTVALTVVTRSHLPLAQILSDGLSGAHPEIPLRAVVVDADAGEEPAGAGFETVSGSELGVERLSWLALKLTPEELCCALKPAAVAQALRAGARRVLYLDSDIEVYDRLDSWLEPLADADWCVAPHARRLFEVADPATAIPSIGDQTLCGLLNAGQFSVRSSPAALAFLDRWSELTTSPGAFVGSWWGGRTEQQVFAWVLAAEGRVHRLDDPGHNVAYWNLHERSLAHHRDPDGSERFTVDGRPLATFHWSGFDVADAARLSRYDSRHSPLADPALGQLATRYRARLAAAGWPGRPPAEWRWDRLPSGVPLDARIRDLVRRFERWLDEGLDPLTEAGERRFLRALLSPLAARRSLVPLLFADLWEERSDLRRAFPEAPFAPESFYRWIARHGVEEYGYAELLDRARPVVATPELGVVVAAVERMAGGVPEPLGAGRRLAATRLEAAGERRLAGALVDAEHEIYATSALGLARALWRGREDLRERFPDPLGVDCGRFADWLANDGRVEHRLPAAVGRRLRMGGRGSLARLFLWLSNGERRQLEHSFALVGVHAEELASEMLEAVASGAELELDDVVAFLWTIETAPERGLRALLELPIHCASPEAMTAALDRADARLSVRPAGRSAAAAERDRMAAERGTAPRVAGVQLWGGVGGGACAAATAGLKRALELAGRPFRFHALFGVAGDSDPELEGVLAPFAVELDTLLFCLHGGARVAPPERLSAARRSGRRAVGLFVWEPACVLESWSTWAAGLDAVWAASSSAAHAFGVAADREVPLLPTALDPTPPATDGLPVDPTAVPDRFRGLLVIDLAEPLDRQHPEGAAEAFRRAFPASDATLLVRLIGRAGGVRLERLRRFAAGLAPELDVRFLDSPLSPAAELGLLASADVLVALDRAEPTAARVAQAIALGTPVVASRAGAHLDLFGDDDAALVEVSEVDVERPSGPFRRGMPWAEPDLDRAAGLLREIRRDPTAVQDRIAAAAAEGLAERAPAAVARRAAALLGWE